MEIDEQREGNPPEEGETFRDLVVAAARKTRLGVKIPATTCSDMETWDEILEELMDRVLWDDRDFDDEELFLDADPDVAADLKARLLISEGYFTAVAPDPGPQEVAAVRKCLSSLCNRKRSKQ